MKTWKDIEMSKFKVGDKVIVVNADSVYDNYFNGDIGVVVDYDTNPKTAGFVRREDGFMMNVYWTEIKHLEENKEMTAEQMRDEVVRIDKRIEEANKDIENAQKEREALVEKLREKGFELTTASEEVTINSVKVGEKYIFISKSVGDDFNNGEVVTITEVLGEHNPYPISAQNSSGVEDALQIHQLKKI